MKIKMFKYFKRFLSIMLIILLSMPSYATLSSSDGSAFVTNLSSVELIQ